jgi:5'(3')-deoxyribonucleotidase
VIKLNSIAVDVDGVLADHVSHILPVLKRDYGLDMAFSQIKVWDFPVGRTTFGTILRTAQKLPEFVLTTPAIRGAREAMRKLSAAFHLAIVTARPPEATDATQHWLRANGFPFDDFANLSEGTKHNTVNPCDLLIDDYKVNIVEYLRNTNGRAILFSQPWNADHSDLEPYLAARRLRGAADWQDVLELVPQLIRPSRK